MKRHRQSRIGRSARVNMRDLLARAVIRGPSLHQSSAKLRKWANEARMAASTFSDAKARDRMLSIADEYDRMAERRERRDRTIRRPL